MIVPLFTGLLAKALVGACLFAGLTWDVLAHGPISHADPRLQAFIVDRRVPWLNAVMAVVTQLGSTLVLIPVLLAASGYLWRRRRDRGGVVCLWAGLGGAVVLYDTFKAVIGRARPPVPQMVLHAGGHAYPSGHATQAIVVWGLLAVVAVTGPRSWSPRARRPVLGAAALMVALIGASRVYLGVHWLTDVLGGYALGGVWLAVLLAGRRRCERAWRNGR